jgi:hypothetical protein
MTRRLAALAAVLVLAAGVAACGGDDDDDAVASGDGTTMTTAAPDDDMAMGDDDAAGDDHMAPEVNPCGPDGDGMLPGMEGETPADDATDVTITAKEYEFSGTDALAAGGMFAVTFENQGEELHELVVMKVPDGEDRSLDELLADESAGDSLTMVGQSFACPGDTADPVGVDLSDSGRYVVVCFIPTGAMPDTDPADFEHLGAPHAMNGMAAEVNVS